MKAAVTILFQVYCGGNIRIYADILGYHHFPEYAELNDRFVYKFRYTIPTVPRLRPLLILLNCSLIFETFLQNLPMV